MRKFLLLILTTLLFSDHPADAMFRTALRTIKPTTATWRTIAKTNIPKTAIPSRTALPVAKNSMRNASQMSGSSSQIQKFSSLADRQALMIGVGIIGTGATVASTDAVAKQNETERLYQKLLQANSLEHARKLIDAADENTLKICTNKIAQNLGTTAWYVILAIMERNPDAENIFIQAASSFKDHENKIDQTEPCNQYKAAGILCYAVCPDDNKVYVLLAKGRKYWSDFGGFSEKTDGHPVCTAARETSEELRFIFDDENQYNTLLNLKKHRCGNTSLYDLLVKHTSNTYQNLIAHIDDKSTFKNEISSSGGPYIQHICQIQYDKNLPQKFEYRKKFMSSKSYVPASWNEIKQLQWVSLDSIMRVVDVTSCERNVSVDSMILRDVFVKSLVIAKPILKNILANIQKTNNDTYSKITKAAATPPSCVSER